MSLETVQKLLSTRERNNGYQVSIKQSIGYDIQMTTKSTYLQIKLYICNFLEPCLTSWHNFLSKVLNRSGCLYNNVTLK